MADLLDFYIPHSPPHARPLIVDSFAGGGGASTGIEMALGRSPDIAINHNAAALALHAANHPQTLHLSENVYRVDPLDHMRGRHIGLMHFSPDCKHFSKAKGGAPVERNIRDLAWIIPGWIERIQKSGGRVDVVTLENVEEWRDWGPLVQTERGLMPCPDRRGQTFEAWCKAIRKLGGKIEWRELRACDYGAPTIRKRLFLVIRFDGLPIVWPEPTHGDPLSDDVLSGRRLPWRTAAEIINWSLPCPSIFDTKAEIWDQYGLRAVRPLADNSMARVARGIDRYVINAQRAFLLNLTHGGRLEDIGDPLRTITCARRGEKAVVAPVLSAFYGPGAGGLDRSASVDQPLRTITTENRHAVAGVFVAQQNNDSRRAGGVNPGRSAGEPLATVTATGSQQMPVAAFVARQFGASTGHALDEPLGTVTAGVNKSMLVMPHLSHLYSSNTAAMRGAVTEPLATVTAGGGHHAIVAPFLSKYYGTGDGARHDEPCHTITVNDRFGHVEAVLDVPPFTPAHEARARQVADMMRAHGMWDEREFVTLDVDGVTLVIVDVGIRMLSQRELFNAQGFPPDYVIDGVWHGEGEARRFVEFPKSVQVSCCGNSVSPQPYAAIVAANCGHLAVSADAEAVA